LGVENDAGTTLTLGSNGSFYITDANGSKVYAGNDLDQAKAKQEERNQIITSGNTGDGAASIGSSTSNSGYNGSTYDEVPTSIDPDPELNAVEKILVSTHGWTDNGDGTVTNKNGGIYDNDAGGYLEGYSFAGPDANPVNNYIPGYSGTVVDITIQIFQLYRAIAAMIYRLT
jgi:hypothetical protein